MLLTQKLKVDKLIELYGKDSSVFKQELPKTYLAFTDVDPDIEFRVLINHVTKPNLICKACMQPNACVRVIYKKTPLHERNKHHDLVRLGVGGVRVSVPMVPYKWAYICSEECLDKFRAYLLVDELKGGSFSA